MIAGVGTAGEAVVFPRDDGEKVSTVRGRAAREERRQAAAQRGGGGGGRWGGGNDVVHHGLI